nr:kinectin 1 [Danio rerio]
MALDMADSQYLLILAPTLVIALMFLFFWLFMKETSYDEVLARQKRDMKLPPAKPDVRKKNEKKKNKKKESSGGGTGGGGGGGESEEDLRDFDTSDATSPTSNDEDSEALPVSPPAAPVQAEPPSGIRERKKKEKKPKSSPTAAPAVVPVVVPITRTTPTTTPALEEPEVNGSKSAVRKEQPILLTKQSSPPKPKASPPAPSETTSKKKAKKQKSEAEEHAPEVKPDPSPPVVKKEEPVITEVKTQDGAAPVSTAAPPTASSSSGRRKKKQKVEAAVTVDEAHVQSSALVIQIGSAAPTNHQNNQNNDTPPPVPAPAKHGKKQKSETNKENSEVKLKELLASLGGLVLSDSDVVSLVSLLRDKSPNALDNWYKSTAKFEPTPQQLAEKDRLLNTLQEEASIAKGKVKQLSQELQAEKQKTGRVESVLHEHRVARDKDIMQAKAQSYQEMQIKFQQIREQLDGQIARLQQENGIPERCQWRDVSTTNQMETKQSSELNKLRSEYNSLMKELAETKNKLQQEELQRKGLEVNYKQNVSQLEDAKHRWEDLQNYLHSVNAEREKIQSELQNQIMVAESEMASKNKEIQSLHSSLKDTLMFKDQEQQKVLQLEQQVRQLLEASQRSMQPDDQLQEKVQDLLNENKTLKVQIDNLQTQLNTQATTVSHFEELQKLLAEKELQRKSLEDSLNAERSSGASRETNMQAMHNENHTLKAELQNLQAQISEKVVSVDQLQQSLQKRDEKTRTVENLLETSLIQVANKEDELKVVRNECEGLKQQLEAVQKQTTEQTVSEKALEELQLKIQEKDEQIKSVEGSLQLAVNKESERKKVVEDLQQQVEVLTAELAHLKTQESNSDLSAKLQELHAQLTAKDQDVERLQRELEKEMQQKQQTVSAAPSQELLTALAEKDKRLSEVQEELLELRESVELHRKKNNELREKNWSAMEALSATETILQGKLTKSAKEHQTVLESVEAECRALLHRLLPHIPLPSDQNHQQWLQKFEASVRESSSGEASSGDAQALAEKLKEAEEAQKVLQKDCETYKKVLAETEGILQRLQSSVEHEETRWREKLDLSQAELKEMTQRAIALDQEVDRLTSDADVESLRRDKQQLESELERAERESATYVSEVRELKTQLTETLCKLETEESERQKVAGDLYKAQQSLELIQEEIVKQAGQADLIETSGLTQMEEIDRKEKMTAGLNQTVQELQELLQSVNRQLTKGHERDDGDKLYSNYKL